MRMQRFTKVLSLVVLVMMEVMTSFSYAITSQVSVTFNSNGGSEVEGIDVEYGQKIEAPADPTRDGYEFKGWAVEETDYTVKYLERGTAMMLAEDKVVTKIPVGTIVTENAEDIDGYYVAGNSKKMKKLGKRFEDNVMRFYYETMPKESYTVHYLDVMTKEKLYPSKVVTDVVIGETVIEDAVTIPGYRLLVPDTQTFVVQQSKQIIKTDFAAPTDDNGGRNMMPCDELQCKVDGLQRLTVVVKTDDYYIVWTRDELNTEEREMMYYSFIEGVPNWKDAEYEDVLFMYGNGSSFGGVTIMDDDIFFDENNDREVVVGQYTMASEEILELCQNEILFLYYQNSVRMMASKYLSSELIPNIESEPEELIEEPVEEVVEHEVNEESKENLVVEEISEEQELQEEDKIEETKDLIEKVEELEKSEELESEEEISEESEPIEEVALFGMVGNPIGELLGDPEGNYRYWDFENDKFYYDTELIAVWEPIIYTIDYEGVDGLENPNPTEYTVETENFDLVSLEKDGYIFEGWYTSEGNQISQIVKGSTGNLVLHPQRKDPAPKYSGGGGAGKSKTTKTESTHNSADTIKSVSDEKAESVTTVKSEEKPESVNNSNDVAKEVTNESNESTEASDNEGNDSYVTYEESKPTLDSDISEKTEIGNTTEMVEAYKFAYDNGITSKESFEEADTDGLLNREELAKMLSQFAINVMGMEPEEGKAGCTSFNDIERESSEMKGYMKTACELGLMGLESDGETVANHFNPKKSVTRAEFGTTLSRLLYQGANNLHDDLDRQNNEWYEKHLRALKDNGIMTQVNGEWVKKIELRGYVMIMLMRSTQD